MILIKNIFIAFLVILFVSCIFIFGSCDLLTTSSSTTNDNIPPSSIVTNQESTAPFPLDGIPGCEVPEKAPDFFDKLLTNLTIPVSNFAISILNKWTQYECTEAQWNPLATIWDTLEKSTDFIPGGVKHYIDKDTGIYATRRTLEQEYCKPIREMLAMQVYDWPSIQQALSTWSGCKLYDNYIIDLVHEWQILVQFENYEITTTFPTVDNFIINNNTFTIGESIIFSFTLSDHSGSGLKQVELWEASDTDGDGEPNWSESSTGYIDMQTTNGQVYTGSFEYVPQEVGTFWYGIHVVDNAGNWNDERNSHSNRLPGIFGPLKIYIIL